MKEITNAEMDIVLKLVKSPEVDYNANSIAKVTGITGFMLIPFWASFFCLHHILLISNTRPIRLF